MHDLSVASFSRAKKLSDVIPTFGSKHSIKTNMCFCQDFYETLQCTALTDFPPLLLAPSTEQERLCGAAFVVLTSLVFSGGV